MSLKVQRLTETAKLPTRNKSGDMGYDIYCDEDVHFNEPYTPIKTGIAIELPEGYGAFLVGRSGLTSKTLYRVNLGVIDNGYRGELLVMNELAYRSTSGEVPQFKQGDKIAQLVVLPIFDGEVVEVNALTVSDRGNKGFGSSGNQ